MEKKKIISDYHTLLTNDTLLMNIINSMNASKYLCSTMLRTFVREKTSAL